jgi:septal ring factor EnvC (AmiA/AmiB activator)
MAVKFMSTAITDPRARFWGKLVAWGMLIPAGFLLAPVIWIALGGLLGLLACIAVLVATWMLKPVVFSFAANMRLKLIKAEASRNPVETLQDDLRKKTVALDERKTNIEKLNAQIRTFADRVSEIRDKYGANDSGFVKLSADLADLRRIYKRRCEKWNEAHVQLGLFGEQIDRANMIWEAAQAAAAARETSGLTEDEFFAKLRTETAFDAIQDSYNQALASLDSDLLEQPAALPSPQARAVEIPNVTSKKVN